MATNHPFEEMLKKISETVRADLGPAYNNIVSSPELALAISAKMTLAIASVASHKLLDRSNQRLIKDFQDACLQSVFTTAISACFQNQALLHKIQAAMVAAVANAAAAEKLNAAAEKLNAAPQKVDPQKK